MSGEEEVVVEVTATAVIAAAETDETIKNLVDAGNLALVPVLPILEMSESKDLAEALSDQEKIDAINVITVFYEAGKTIHDAHKVEKTKDTRIAKKNRNKMRKWMKVNCMNIPELHEFPCFAGTNI